MSEASKNEPGDRIENGGSNQDAHQRRTGGSPGDPHGGVELPVSRVGTGPAPDAPDEGARVNVEAGRDDVEHRSAPDLRGGDQPVLRSDNEITINSEDGRAVSRRKV